MIVGITTKSCWTATDDDDASNIKSKKWYETQIILPSYLPCKQDFIP